MKTLTLLYCRSSFFRFPLGIGIVLFHLYWLWCIDCSVKIKNKKMSRVGRPTSIIELNLNKIDQTVQNIISLCSNHIVKSKVLQLCAALKTNFLTVTTISTQSDLERSLSETGTQTSTHFNETGSQTSTHFSCFLSLSVPNSLFFAAGAVNLEPSGDWSTSCWHSSFLLPGFVLMLS